MYSILSVILLGIAANLDNLAIGLAYGIRGIKVPFKSNFTFAALSGAATLVSGCAGHLLSHIIPKNVGNILGGAIVSVIGIYTILSFIFHDKKLQKADLTNESLSVSSLGNIMDDPYSADVDNSGDISFKEAFVLGTALALNCLAAGFGAGMTGVNILGLILSVMFFSLLTIGLGTHFGKKYASRYFGDKATVAAGILLLIVGLYEMLI